MSYQVRFSETTNPAKPTITVQDQTLDNTTSLTFVGKNYSGYAPVVAENFLHLLENFAKNTAPANPVEGQLWYDNSADVNLLKVYDGTRWSAAGSVKKSSTRPGAALAGDLWADTANQQLYIYSGSNWLLVGPQFSSGTNTGTTVETIVDTTNTAHAVLTFYSNNNRMAIVSKEAFSPKSAMAGFTTINQGVNLSSIDATNTTAPTKFWGTASASDALNVSGSSVAASNFLRSDVSATANAPFSVRSNGGISLGSDLSFNIGTDNTSTIFYSKNSGNSIDFNVTLAGTTQTSLHLDANTYVGIGPNNTNPAEALDVAGSISVDNDIIVLGTSPSTSLATGSVRVAGGIAVGKSSTFGGNLGITGQIFINNLDTNGDPTPGSVLVPGTDAGANIYDIGSETRPFRNVYADTFVGAFNGEFTGSLSGSISGSSARWASPTVFSLSGDLTSPGVSVDGQSNGGVAVLTATVSQDFITSKPTTTESLSTDTLLVYRSGNDSGLKKITKQSLLSNVATIPVGTILPFAGTTVPAGYLLCDGSEVPIGTYSVLFGIIGYTYKAASTLVGSNTFGLPDLRGRFALGRDNMDNGTTVPDKNDPSILINAGGGSANRVTSPIADTIGQGTGDESATLSVSNLPDHTHNLSNSTAPYYSAGLPNGTADPAARANAGMPETSTGYGLPVTGSVLAPTLGSAFSLMNPYMAVNYIIFTGVL